MFYNFDRGFGNRREKIYCGKGKSCRKKINKRVEKWKKLKN